METRYGEPWFNLEHINPPINAQTNGKTYPIGSTNAVGSSVSNAAAELANINANPTPTVTSIPQKDDFKVFSIGASLFIVFFLLDL
jgi:hypothetical protein